MNTKLKDKQALSLRMAANNVAVFLQQKRRPLNRFLDRSARIFFALAISTIGMPVQSQAGGVLPTGGKFVAGQGAIATSPGTIVINQSSKAGIINWQGFSISAGNGAQFNNGTGATLNRVTGGNLSQIDGSLSATGSVYLINPQGVVVGAGGKVVTNGSFVATTRDISNSAFMSGQPLQATGSSNGGIINLGTITSQTGNVTLIGQSVSNSGTISAPNGAASLAAGNNVLMVPAGSGAPIAIATGAGDVTNTGAITAAQAELNAAGGNVYALAGNNGGIVRATGTTTKDGHVWLTAGGNVTVGGKVSAQNANGSGGTVEATGGAAGTVTVSGSISANGGPGTSGGKIVTTAGTVAVTSTAQISANGGTGGGTILIGGDRHGGSDVSQDFSSTPVANAQTTTVANGATISANAGSSGNGGNVVVWSDQVTNFDGSISAVGGKSSGNGGFVETSGEQLLSFNGTVDTLAPAGVTGTLLLDPANVTISTNANSNESAGGTTFSPTSGQATSNINNGILETALASNNINVTTTNTGTSGAGAGNITVSAPVIWTGTHSLSLNAAGAITVNAAITVTGAAGTSGSAAGAAGGVTLNGSSIAINAALSSTGGAGFSPTTGNNSGGTGGAGGAISLTSTGGAISVGAGISSTGGAAGNGHANGNGGTGGTGGAISFNSTGGGITITGDISSVGGSGGNGGNNGSAGASGTNGTVTTTSAGTITDASNVITAATLTGSSVGNASFGGANQIANLGAFTTTSSGALSLTDGSALTTTGTVTTAGNLSLTDTASGGITVNSNVTANGTSAVLTADSVSVPSSLTGAGTVTLAPYTTSLAINVGGTPSSGLALSTSNLNNITASTLQVGTSSDTGLMTVTGTLSSASGGALDNITNLSLLTGGAIDVNNAITLTGAGGTNGSDNGGAGGTITLSGNALTLDAAISSTGGSAYLFGGNGNGGAGGAITLTSTSGNIEIGGNVSSAGGAKRGTGTVGGGSLVTVNSAGNLTIDNHDQVSSAMTSGTSVVLAAGNDFINSAGSTAVSLSGAARWLVYSSAPSGDTFGNLDSGNTAIWDTTYPTSVSATGNRYVFALQPTLTITTTNASSTYGTAPSISSAYSVSGLEAAVTGAYKADTAAAVYSGAPTLSVDSPNYSTSGNLDAGTYTIDAAAGTLTALNGYAFSFADSGKLTVNQLALTASIADVNSTYGDGAGTGAVSLNGVLTNDVVTADAATIVGANYSGSGHLDAGSYAQTVDSTLGGADANNYSFTGFTTASDNFTVGKLALTASIADASSTYGDAVTPGAVTLIGNLANDDVSADGATIVHTSGQLSGSGHLDAGSYAQAVDSGLNGGDASNYSFTGFTTGTDNYTVNKLALTGASIAGVTTTYGTSAATGAVSFGNVVGGDVVNATATIVNPNTSSSNHLDAGSYAQSVSAANLSGTDAGNYSLATFTTGTNNYVVNQLALTASIADVNSTYGDGAGTGAVSLNGVLTNDVVTADAATIVGANYSGSGHLDAGSYAQTVDSTLGGADANNYSFTGFTTASDNFTVGKLALTASIADASSTYGDAVTPGAVTLIGNLANDDVSADGATIVHTSGQLSGSGHLDAGSYAQAVDSGLNGGDASNYSFTGFTTGTDNYTVNKLALTGSIGSGSSTYGSSLNPGSANLTDVIHNDHVGATVAVNTTGNTSSSGHLNAGFYTGIEYISGLTGADAGNYSFGNIAGNYTVNKLALTGTAIAGASSTYGSAVTPGTVSFGDVVSGDVVGATASVVSTAGNLSSSGHLDADNYRQTVTAANLSGTDAGNYSLSNFTTGTHNYTVNQLALTGAQIAAVTTTYGTPASTGAVTFNNIINGDHVTADTATIVGSNFSTSHNLDAGSYKQTVDDNLNGADSNNYSFGGFTTATANYTVNQLALTGTAIASSSSTYGSTLNPGTVSFNDVKNGDRVTAAATVNTSALSTSGHPNAGSYTQSVTSAGLSGSDADNYSLASFTTATANYTINKLALNASIAGVTTTYGTPAAAGAVSFSNVVGNDQVNPGTASVVSNASNISGSGNLDAGNYRQTVGSTLSGADMGDYSFAGFTTSSHNYTVNQLALTGTAIAASSSTYGSATNPGAVSFGDVISGDDVSAGAHVVFSFFTDLSTSGNLKAGSYAQRVSSFDLGGADSGNYSLATFTTATNNYTVNKLALTGAAIAPVTTTYGTPAATGAVTFTNIVGQDHVGAGTASLVNPNYSTSNNLDAGSYAQMVGSALTGSDANNYSFAGFTTATDNYTVNQLALTGTAIAPVTTTYGTSAATGAVIFGNVISGDVVNGTANLVNPGYSTSNNLDAGSYAQTVTSAGLRGADAGNYSVNFTTATNNYVVNQLALTGTSITASSSVYGSALNPGAVSFGNVVTGDDVTAAATVDTSTLSTGGHPIVGLYAQTVTGADLSGADAGNYSFGSFTTGPANYNITPLALSASIAGVTTTYGTSAATGAVTFGNVINGDVVSGTATIVNPVDSTSGNLDAGTYKQRVKTANLSGADAGNYTVDFTTAPGNYVVNQLALTGTAIADASSTYGDTVVTGAVSFGNVVSGDLVSGTATIVNPNYSTSGNLDAGTYKQKVNTGDLSGADAGNYTVNFTETPANYTVGQLALTGTAIAGVTTTYGTPAATGAVSFGDVISGDLVSATANLVNPNYSSSNNLDAGTYKQRVTAADLSGADAGNYSLATYTTVPGNYTVNQLALTGTAIAGVTTTYGTSAATGAVTFGNVINGDVVSGTATIVNPVDSTSGNLDAGTYKQRVKTANLSGADAGNYTVDFTTAPGNYVVNQLALTGTAIADASSTYGDTVVTGAVSFGNVVSGDVVDGTAEIVNPNYSTSGNLDAGTYKQQVKTGDLSGADAGNYTVNFTETPANYTVGQLALTGTAIADASSTYGDTVVTGAVSFGNVVSGDVVDGTAEIVNPNYSTSGNLDAGTYKQQVKTADLSGADAGNYTVNFTEKPANYTVNQLALTGTAIADASSTYGDTVVTGAVSFGNVVSGDLVSGTATIVNPNYSTSGNLDAGTYKQKVNTGDLSGADAGNYTVNFTETPANYTVGQLALTGTAIADASSTYGDTVVTGAVSFGNVVSGDVVDGTAEIVNPNYSTSGNLDAGTYKQQVKTADLSGADAGNYTVNFTEKPANYTVNQLALTASIADASSTYGDTVTPGAVSFTNLVSNDVVTADAATIVNPNYSTSGHLDAGNYAQAVDATLGGADAGNYSFAGFTTATANYTVGTLALTGAQIAGVSTTYGTPAATGAVSFGNVISGDIVTADTATIVNPNFSTSHNVDAGSYAQTVDGGLNGADASNYSFGGVTTATSNYTVGKLALTASIADAGSTYGDAVTPGAVSFGNAISGDNVTADAASIVNPNFSSSHNLDAGSYKQTVDGGLNGADASNYSFGGVTTATSNYTVGKLALTASIADAGSTYGDAVTPGAVSFGNAISGDNVTADAASIVNPVNSTSGHLDAGSYAQAVDGGLNGADAGNYSFVGFTTPTANYTVALRGLDITANDFSSDTLADAQPTASYAGFASGDDASLVNSLQFALLGVSGKSLLYDVVPFGASAANYAISYTGGLLTLTPQTPGVFTAPLVPNGVNFTLNVGGTSTSFSNVSTSAIGDAGDTFVYDITWPGTLSGVSEIVLTNYSNATNDNDRVVPQ